MKKLKSLYNFIYLWIIAYIAEIKEQRLLRKQYNDFKKCQNLRRFFLAVMILVALLKFCNTAFTAGFDYENATREELLGRCLVLATRLHGSITMHKASVIQYNIALQAVEALQIENQRLFNILENPNEFGDTEFNINAGIGTAITCTAQGSLYLFQNLRFILKSSIIIPNYWNSEVAFIPTCTAGIGFRF